MRAAIYREFGEPDVLRIEDVPEPHAPAGMIRIVTLAASVNPVDVFLRSGRAQAMMPVTLPTIPGRDAAGIVDEVGEGVTDVVVGDFVFGLGGLSDTSAEYSVLSAWAKMPKGWSAEQGAAAGLAANTAVRGLEALGDLSGKTLLIEGAAGSVGSAAAAIAMSRGARVIGTASPRNHDFLRAIGVVPTTYGAGLIERVAVLAPEGVDAALDTAGAGSLPDLVEITGDPRRVATIADAPRAHALGVHAVNAQNDSATLRVAAELGSKGAYSPRVEKVLPLDRIAEAHTLVQTGRSNGKLVIAISNRSF